MFHNDIDIENTAYVQTSFVFIGTSASKTQQALRILCINII